jgi:hypothetical protein
MINYQGKVTDASGNPVSDGSYTMRFRIYDQFIGGTPLWDSGNQSVNLAGGIFSIVLGGTGYPTLDLAFDADYWLLVTFAGVDQTPRHRLTAAGYAYLASGLVPGTEVTGSVTNAPYAAMKGTNTGTANDVVGLYGESACPGGGGIFGYGTATTSENYGVFGMSLSTEGIGVYGVAAATGVYGHASADTGYTFGVYGESASTSGFGVYASATATTGSTEGVSALSNSTSGRGVCGYAMATTGITYGGLFQSRSTSGRGVFGNASADSGTTYGGSFQSNSTSGMGVKGTASATTGTNYGVYGWSSSPSGYGVYYSGGITGTGAKNCVVRTSNGPTLMYCQESPEAWFEDFGEGQLVDGECHIELEPLFLETVIIDEANPMKVFVQLHDEASHGVAVKKGFSGFDVLELENGVSTGTFDYRVVAKRKGFETRRLDYCKAAEDDPYLFPELREIELQELRPERARHERGTHPNGGGAPRAPRDQRNRAEAHASLTRHEQIRE